MSSYRIQHLIDPKAGSANTISINVLRERGLSKHGKSLRMEDDWAEDENYIFDDSDLIHRCFHYVCPDCAELSPAYGLALLARTTL